MKSNNDTMNAKYIWPEIFDNPEAIASRDLRALCADGFCGWAICMCGNKPPESFGDVLVAIGLRLGMKKAATAEALSEHAHARGWITE